MAARTAPEKRALQVLARVVSDSPFRPAELIDRVCAGTREAFGLEGVEWRPEGLVPVPRAGEPAPDEADLSVLSALGEAAAAVADRARDIDRADRLKTDFVSIASHELRARPRVGDRLRVRRRDRRFARLRAGAAARRALHADATGSSKLKHEPSPSRESTVIVPFIRRTSSRQM
jgi:hypothetical protein